MIAELKPYPATKDSGVPWLGEIPEHWRVLRGRHLFEIKKRIAGELGHRVLSVTQAGLRVKDVESGEGQVSQDYSKYQIVKSGDFVMNSMDLVTGGVGIADSVGVTSPDYRVFAIRDTALYRDRYVLHMFRMLYANRGFYAWGQGSAQLGRWRLPRKRFNEFPFAVPPVCEQAAIVSFLDHTDRRMRRYIRAKQKLIELLEEQKQAIIHRAVTRGIDPNVRLKASGLEWVGDIPEHWEVARLKSLVSRVTSGSRGWSNFAADSGVLFIRIGNLTRASIGLRMDDVIRLQLPEQVFGEAARTRVQPSDILLSITAFIGSVAVVPPGFEEAYVSQHVACCRPRPGRSNPRWIAYVLLSPVGQAHGQLSMYGGTKQGLSLDDVKNYPVLLPPLKEQARIVDWIEDAAVTLDAGLASAAAEIALLREFRTRLIADVVTGKLDVRDLAARLPDEREVPETLEEAEDESTAEEPADGLDLVPEEAEA